METTELHSRGLKLETETGRTRDALVGNLGTTVAKCWGGSFREDSYDFRKVRSTIKALSD